MDNELLLIEWVDSTQPISKWHYLSDMPINDVVRCVSVGWLMQETGESLMLAPNIGGYDSGGGSQGSGFIRIPKLCITRRAVLTE